jgi:HEAT repeat protein
LNSSPPADVCDVIEIDKIDRLLGNKAAGFSHAKVWMESPDPSLRSKAVWIFKDIGDADSQAALEKLSSDKDPVISMEADVARRKLEQGNPPTHQ